MLILEDVKSGGVRIETSNLLPMTIQAFLMFVELVVLLIVASLVRSSHDLEGYLHLFDLGPQLAQGLPSLSQVLLEAISLGKDEFQSTANRWKELTPLGVVPSRSRTIGDPR